MKRFKNILFYVDGMDNPTPSLHRAVNLAESNQARLTLIDVIQPVTTPAQVKTRFNLEFTDLLLEQRKQALENLCHEIRQEDCIINNTVLKGVPFVEVIKLIQQGNYDLLMKEARPPGGINERLFGGNDLHLFRKCPCPVLIGHPETLKPYQNVLAAVDTGSTGNLNCDAQVMDLATSLAQREQAQLSVIHAWELPGESAFRSSQFHLTGIELDTMQTYEIETRKNKLNSFLKNYDLSTQDEQVHLIKGSATESINNLAKLINADIIVMGTLGRTGIPGFFIGSTAEEVLHTTNASVLAVKPPGFISPVQ